MSEFKPGDEVLAVEYSEATHAPVEGGKTFAAKVVGTEGIYVQVRYDDAEVFGGRTDVFYKSSLWRAWDGQLRWRLMAAQERPHRIDPPGCGCTDCLTRWSVPLDEASANDVFAMRAGRIQDATSEEFQTVTAEGWSGTTVTIRARWSGREWTRETENSEEQP